MGDAAAQPDDAAQPASAPFAFTGGRNAHDAAPDAQASPKGRRRAARGVQRTLACNLGEVLDLSEHGLRVRCRKAPAGRTPITLINHTSPGQLHANVVWSKPSGNFHHEVGLEFERVSPDMARRLKSIASDLRFRRAC